MKDIRDCSNRLPVEMIFVVCDSGIERYFFNLWLFTFLNAVFQRMKDDLSDGERWPFRITMI